MSEPETEKDAQQRPEKQVALQKIYVRDASVEVPGGPRVFTQTWRPHNDVELNSRVQSIDESHHQVTLVITLTAKQEDKVAYVVEVEQAGIFKLHGFDDPEEERHILAAYCPSVLFPFARELVADLVQRAGFPQYLLQPVNFDALYQRHLEQQRKAGVKQGAH